MFTESDQLLRLFQEQHRCLSELREVADKQRRLIAAGEMEPLLQLLAGKQRLLATFQQLEEQLAPYRAAEAETRAWRSPQHRAACIKLKEVCSALLAEVIQQEKASEGEIVTQRDEAARRLQALNHAVTARGAYSIAANGPTQLNLVSEL